MPARKHRPLHGAKTVQDAYFQLLSKEAELTVEVHYQRYDFPRSQGSFVQHALSLLLPVKDAQATLTALVHDHLDMATDLGGPFELLIIDDGSTDATSEVAHELTRDYPQIRVVRHGMTLGREAAIRTGMDQCRGERIVVRDESGRFRVFERRSPARRTASRPARPNYLSRLRDFVVSE